MKFGCCLNMVASERDGIGAEYMDALAAIGYDYVELPLAEIMHLSERDFLRLKTGMERHNLMCEACNNFFPKDMRLTGREINKEQILKYVEQALDRAKALGAVRVVFGSGPAKNVPDEISLEQGYTQILDLLKNIAPMAARRQIIICIEPLRKKECNLINTFAEGCKLADDAGHPNIRVLADYYHMTEEREPMENLSALGKNHLKHVHFSSSERLFPMDMNEVSYGAFIQALGDIGYDERVSCEAYSSAFMEEASKTLDFLRRYMKSKGGCGNV